MASPIHPMLSGALTRRFQLHDHLGRGGIGDVYHAHDRTSGSSVALKLIRTGTTDPEMLEAERRGIALQRRLHRFVPEIAEVYDSGDIDGFFYISMEYVEGPDLSSILSGTGLPEVQAVGIALQLCRILEKIERTGVNSTGDRRGSVIHGDIKPENIRLQRGERVRLLDFGVAKNLSHSKQFTRQVFGSVPYLSPERLLRGVLDRHSDLWAVAVALYQMLSGQLPFPGHSVEEVERRILNGSPPSRLPATCSSNLERIVFKGLAFEVEDRYPSVAALRADLEAFLGRRPVSAGPVRDSSPALATTRTRPSEQNAPPPGPPHRPKTASMLTGGGGRGRGGAAQKGTLWKGLLVLLLLAILLAGGAIREWKFWTAARSLRQRIVGPLSPQEASAALSEYRDLAKNSLLDAGLQDVRRPLGRALADAANRAIDFSGPSTLDIQTWQSAKDELRGAIELLGDDAKLRARLLVYDGNIRRLTAQQQLDSGFLDQGRASFQSALGSFKQAAQLDPEWLGPHASLAWLHGLPPASLGWSSDRELRNALDQATQRGYLLSAEDESLLAEVDLRAAMELRRRASGIYDSSQAIELLLTAEKLVQDAIEKQRDQRSLMVFQAELGAVREDLAARGVGRWDLQQIAP